MLPPVAVALIFQDGMELAFIEAFGLTLVAGIMIWFPVRDVTEQLRLRHGFLIVAAFWMGLGAAGSLPFMLMNAPGMTFADAMFEAMSGLTTTGSTVLTGLDYLPHSVLYYRQQL